MSNQTITFSKECRTIGLKTCNDVSYADMCENFNCYELIPDNRKVKPYFDVEIKPRHCVDEHKYLDCWKDICSIAIHFLNKEFKEANYSILNASSADYICCETGLNKWIISFHIIISNYLVSKKKLKYMVIKMNEVILNEMNTNTQFELTDYYNFKKTHDNRYDFQLFDNSVYDDNRKMRSAFANKTYYDKTKNKVVIENRPLVIENGSFEQSVISAFNDVNTIEIPDDIEFKSISPSPTSVIQLIDQENNKHIDLFYKIGNTGYKRADWVSLCGWCHANATRDIFINFVSRDWKDDAEKMWDSMKPKSIPIYWIETFAKRVNLPVYKNWIDKWNIYHIDANDIEDTFKVASIISVTLKSTLVLCGEKWYMLTSNQLWKQQKEPSFYIINELRKYIDESNKKIVFQISQSDGDVKDKLVEKSKIYLKSYKTISTSGYLNVITKYLKTLLADNTFEKKLDNNAGELAFQNGIMDLETKQFRIGIQADDFLTDTIPYDYKPACNIKKEFIKNKLLEILNNNSEHLDYFLSLIGFSFIGAPHLEKSLYFCVDKTDKSSGDNGKTFFFDILSTLLPNYVYKTNKTFLEDKNAKVHKQLIMMKGKRLVWLDEFNEKKTNAELMKVIGEGTQLENEVLFGTTEIVNILFKLWTLTNHIPNIDAKETAVYNRYKQISYGSHFDRTGKRKQANPSSLEFIADPTLGDTIKNSYYNEVFEIIIEYAHKYYKNNIPPIPEQFQQDTKATQKKNDTYATFFEEECEVNECGRIALKALVKRSGLSEILIKEGMIRLGFKYDKDLMKLGKDETGKYYKGGFIGCNIKEEIFEEEE